MIKNSLQASKQFLSNAFEAKFLSTQCLKLDQKCLIQQLNNFVLSFSASKHKLSHSFIVSFIDISVVKMRLFEGFLNTVVESLVISELRLRPLKRPEINDKVVLQ